MEAALAFPAINGADVSTAADAAIANTMVLMFVPLLPLPSQREKLQLVPGGKWWHRRRRPRSKRSKGVMRLTVGRRPACNRSLRDTTGVGAPQSAAGSGWNEGAGRYSPSSRKAP